MLVRACSCVSDLLSLHLSLCSALSTMDPVDWANESFKLVRTNVYCTDENDPHCGPIDSCPEHTCSRCSHRACSWRSPECCRRRGGTVFDRMLAPEEPHTDLRCSSGRTIPPESDARRPRRSGTGKRCTSCSRRCRPRTSCPRAPCRWAGIALGIEPSTRCRPVPGSEASSQDPIHTCGNLSRRASKLRTNQWRHRTDGTDARRPAYPRRIPMDTG